MSDTDFPRVFGELRSLLVPFAGALTVTEDSDTVYALDTPWSERWKRELFFGKAEITKRYVSFHLFPVYMYPDLLDDVSDDLRARMQGKSCFNFTRVDPEQFEELRDLTAAGWRRLEREGVVTPDAAGDAD